MRETHTSCRSESSSKLLGRLDNPPESTNGFPLAGLQLLCPRLARLFLDNNKAKKHHTLSSAKLDTPKSQLCKITKIAKWTLFSPEERRYLFDWCQTGPDTHLL